MWTGAALYNRGPMVRPERRDVLASASPARESAGAPGSRLQLGGEILQIASRKVFGRAGTIISRRRQQTASWTGAGAGPPRGFQAASRNRAERNRRDPSGTRKIIVKPCAGKRHARFERGIRNGLT